MKVREGRKEQRRKTGRKERKEKAKKEMRKYLYGPGPKPHQFAGALGNDHSH